MGSAPPNDQVYTTVAAVLVPLILVIAVVIGCVMWRHRNSLGGAVGWWTVWLLMVVILGN